MESTQLWLATILKLKKVRCNYTIHKCWPLQVSVDNSGNTSPGKEEHTHTTHPRKDTGPKKPKSDAKSKKKKEKKPLELPKWVPDDSISDCQYCTKPFSALFFRFKVCVTHALQLYLPDAESLSSSRLTWTIFPNRLVWWDLLPILHHWYAPPPIWYSKPCYCLLEMPWYRAQGRAAWSEKAR